MRLKKIISLCYDFLLWDSGVLSPFMAKFYYEIKERYLPLLQPFTVGLKSIIFLHKNIFSREKRNFPKHARNSGQSVEPPGGGGAVQCPQPQATWCTGTYRVIIFAHTRIAIILK